MRPPVKAHAKTQINTVNFCDDKAGYHQHFGLLLDWRGLNGKNLGINREIGKILDIWGRFHFLLTKFDKIRPTKCLRKKADANMQRYWWAANFLVYFQPNVKFKLKDHFLTKDRQCLWINQNVSLRSNMFYILKTEAFSPIRYWVQTSEDIQYQTINLMSFHKKDQRQM